MGIQTQKKKRVLSAIQPSGHLCISNHIGAIKNWVKLQDEYDCVYLIVDLHSLTVNQVPSELRNRCYSYIAQYLACGIDPKEYDNKLVYLMSVEKAKFRNPVLPDCELHLEIEAIRSHGRVWKYIGEAYVEDKKMADAQWSATIVDRK